MVSIRALVVDDERLARVRLRRLLVEQGVEVLGEGVDGQEAIELARQLPADILFIDINMPKKNGLDAAAEISSSLEQPPTIVFCTAYDEYALQAFESNASAYLLKPVSAEELAMVIKRAAQLSRLQAASYAQNVKAGNQAGGPAPLTTLAIGVGDALENIDVLEIEYFRSIDKHVFAGIKGRGEVLVDETLKQLQVKLAPVFVRAHRSALVNVHEISKLTRDDRGQSSIHLYSGVLSLPVSRRHLSEVKKCFQ